MYDKFRVICCENREKYPGKLFIDIYPADYVTHELLYRMRLKITPDVYDITGGVYLDDLGRVQQAIELFEKAIKYNPNYALAHYNKARAIVIRGDYIEAARYYQIALDLNKITNEMDPEEIKNRLDNLFD